MTLVEEFYLVLVPVQGTAAAARIDARAGIVTTPEQAAGHPSTPVLVYFEGNRYGAENLTAFDDRLLHAADRMRRRYPTVARGFFPREDFRTVGTYADGRLEVSDPVTLTGWLAGHPAQAEATP
jgi:hypothetical protein